MKPNTLVVIGASAGGVEALRSLVAGLPEQLEAAICVVLHTPADSASGLPSILARAGRLPAEHARDGQPLRAGCILVAPPDRHLSVLDGKVRVARGPKENGHRPAIDPLFRSAARAAGEGVIGVVLSGVLDDGAAGLQAISNGGGLVIVQDPADALFDAMPMSAIERVGRPDHVVPAQELGSLIGLLVGRQAITGGAPMRTTQPANAVEEPAKGDYADMYRDPPGAPSHYSCPDCGGVLWHGHDPMDADLRCRVGHAYSFVALERGQRDGVEAALWTALRALEENALTSGRLAGDSRTAGRPHAAERFAARQQQAERQAAVIRRALDEDENLVPAGE